MDGSDVQPDTSGLYTAPGEGRGDLAAASGEGDADDAAIEGEGDDATTTSGEANADDEGVGGAATTAGDEAATEGESGDAATDADDVQPGATRREGRGLGPGRVCSRVGCGRRGGEAQAAGEPWRGYRGPRAQRRRHDSAGRPEIDADGQVEADPVDAGATAAPTAGGGRGDGGGGRQGEGPGRRYPAYGTSGTLQRSAGR